MSFWAAVRFEFFDRILPIGLVAIVVWYTMHAIAYAQHFPWAARFSQVRARRKERRDRAYFAKLSLPTTWASSNHDRLRSKLQSRRNGGGL